MEVTYEDFKKLDIRVVRPIKAETIPGKTRILKLVVDLGSGESRTMIAGGAEFYKPENFLNRKFVAIVNLAPKRIAGVTSRGMLLAAVVGDRPLWLTIDDEAPVGSKVI
jgi:tRNA-binding protein